MADDTRFAFIVEWYEELAARTRTFQFFFFSGSKSIEMFDIKTRKMFLKTNLSSCPIELQDLYIGASVNVLGRQLTVVDYGDEFTKRKLMIKLERTLGLIKPDTLDKMGDIIDAIYERGLLISKMRLCRLEQNDAFRFYQEHSGKSFMNDLLNYVTSGPVLAFELVGDNAIHRWRQLIGPTDPVKARAEATTTLRARFGKGVAGRIISAIHAAGYTVNSIQMFHMEKANVEEFYEVYKGVVHEYPAMVNELASGPVVAMEILGKSEKVAEAFREFCGPMDPEIARHLRPHTLRALYGLNKSQNAVHCTDLPEDAALEVEYFFKVLDR